MQRETIRFYHSTASANVPDIMAHGLIPGKAKGADYWAKTHAEYGDASDLDERPKSVYLAYDLIVAKAFAQYPAVVNHSDAAILRIDMPRSFAESHVLRDEQSMYGYRIESTIPPEWIRVVSPRYSLRAARAINERYHLTIPA